MAQERGTGALLKVKHGYGRESTFYGGSIYLTKASQKNLTLARKRNLDKQSDNEYHYEVKQIYKKKWSLRQHLLRLQMEKERVKYLDGGSRGKPRSQWDTSVDDVIVRHARAVHNIPTRVSKSDETLSQKVIKYEQQTSQTESTGIPEPTRTRLAAYGLFAVASEENLPLRISGRPLALKMRNNTTTQGDTKLFPDINNNQRVTCTSSDLSCTMRRPKLRHSNTTLDAVPSFYLGRRRLSRSLTDLKDLREMSKTLESAI